MSEERSVTNPIFCVRRPFILAALPLVLGVIWLPLVAVFLAETSSFFAGGLAAVIATIVSAVTLLVALPWHLIWLWSLRTKMIDKRRLLAGPYFIRFAMAAALAPFLFFGGVVFMNVLDEIGADRPIFEVLVDNLGYEADILIITGPFSLFTYVLMSVSGYVALLLFSLKRAE